MIGTREATLIVWAGVAVLVGGCAVLSALRPQSVSSFGASVRALISSPYSRVLIVLGWMWLGWHLFAR